MRSAEHAEHNHRDPHPDFRKSDAAVEAIVDAGPDVYNHNLETVPRLYPTIRPGARYLPYDCWKREAQGYMSSPSRV